MAADTRAEHSRPLLTGAALLAVEGVALLASGLWLGIRALGNDVTDRTGAEVGGLVAILAGAGLLVLARAVLARRRWVRSPVIVLQILFLPVGWGLLQAGRPAFGVPMIVVPLATLITLGMARALTPD